MIEKKLHFLVLYFLQHLLQSGHWQLPTYSGTKSYQNLLVEVYGIQESRNNSVGRMINSDSSIQLMPVNFIRSGYQAYSGFTAAHSANGYYWLSNFYSDVATRHLVFDSINLEVHAANNKGYGFSIRCLVR